MSFDISSLSFAYNTVAFKKRIRRAAGRVIWMLSLARWHLAGCRLS